MKKKEKQTRFREEAILAGSASKEARASFKASSSGTGAAGWMIRPGWAGGHHHKLALPLDHADVLTNLVGVEGCTEEVGVALDAPVGNVEVAPGTHGAEIGGQIQIPLGWTGVVDHAHCISHGRAQGAVGIALPAGLALH